MTPPQLTFFCELDIGPLQALFTDQVIDDLVALKATVSIGLLDLEPERAAVIARLNKAGVPVIAWLLLPKDQGFWFNLGNAEQAFRRYEAFKDWSGHYGLHWVGVGLDIEPDIRDLQKFAESRWRMGSALLGRAFDYKRLKNGRAAYIDLVKTIRSDGFQAISFQFPLIADERSVGSTLLQRLAGLVDLPVDREVWMLYTSFLRPNGAGILASYVPQAQAIGLGVTGGGIDLGITNRMPLSWSEFERDLRLAWFYGCDDIHIFSLEGCVERGFLQRLKSFAWDYPLLTPDESLVRVENWRWSLRAGLWLNAHGKEILLAVAAVVIFWKWLRRILQRNS